MEAENLFLSAFQQLLKIKPESFKDSERKELEGLIISLPNDATPLAEAIADWCASHLEINNALMQILEGSLTTKNSRGVTDTLSNPQTKLEDEKNFRETLLNLI